MAKLIVIEGLDGSGKETQAKLLREKLLQDGTEVRMLSFPNYESQSSSLVKMYLNGDFGTDPDDVNAYAASSFYAVDRYATMKKELNSCSDNTIIIADRYTTSNAIHQCSKLPKEEWEVFLDWLFDFEYGKLEIPSPEMVFYLQVDPEISRKLLEKRYEGNLTKEDIHERNREYLERCRTAADHCAKKLNWTIINCCENGEMRTIDSIHDEIYRKVTANMPELRD